MDHAAEHSRALDIRTLGPRCAGEPIRIPTWSKNCHFMIGELSKKAKPTSDPVALDRLIPLSGTREIKPAKRLTNRSRSGRGNNLGRGATEVEAH